jgi:hypothetical protein
MELDVTLPAEYLRNGKSSHNKKKRKFKKMDPHPVIVGFLVSIV